MDGVVIGAVADVRGPPAEVFHERFGTRYCTTDPQRPIEDPNLMRCSSAYPTPMPIWRFEVRLRKARAAVPMALLSSEVSRFGRSAGRCQAALTPSSFSGGRGGTERSASHGSSPPRPPDRLPEESHYMTPHWAAAFSRTWGLI
jgi:hypothetical protein